MDRPVKVYGKGHRKLFHDVHWARFIAQMEYPADPYAEKSALLHLEFDFWCSEDKEFKDLLEKWAKDKIKERKSWKKTTKIIQESKGTKLKRKGKRKRKDSFDMLLDYYKDISRRGNKKF